MSDAGISMDQIAGAGARPGDPARRRSSCASSRTTWSAPARSGYSCAYSNTCPGATPTTPLPMENDPARRVRAAVRRRRQHRSARRGWRACAADRSILDSLTERARAAATSGSVRAIAPRSSEYLDAVRDVERRIQMAETQSPASCRRSSSRPASRRRSTSTRKLMFDLQVLAYQTDLTRVITS